ncbi:MAG: P27 family phage terminase small subunit [Planctomycetota bacterium]
MGRRGPLPKPTAQRIAEGNPSRRPLPENEPTPDLVDAVPPPPEWMTDNAVACDAWTAAATHLHASGMLANLDLVALEQFAIAYAEWRRMLAEARTTGFVERFTNDDGTPKYAAQSPEVLLALKFAAEVNRWCKVLGIGPAYRVGLQLGPAGKNENNPLINLFSGDN